VLKFAVGGPLLPAIVVVGSVLLARRVLGPTRIDPKILAAGQRDPEPARPPDIILPPAVADSSTATLSATVGLSGADVQQDLYSRQEAPTDADKAEEAGPDADGGAPGADPTSPAPATWCRCRAAGT
jgi:hypothetical protein